MGIIEFISQPWHWAVSGAGIVFVMFLLLWFGGEFGVSSNLRTLVAMGGAGSHCQFFDFKWKNQVWNLVFIGGAIIGGYLGISVFGSPEPVAISDSTQAYLETIGITYPQTIEEGRGYVPRELFTFGQIETWKALVLLIVGGFFVGFGARYAGGCTSGHAISGLSNLQVPSLIAVIGFFIGGLAMAWFILPTILQL